MREIYRNPVLYYLLIPVLVGLWPLLVWGVYLPGSEHQREVEQALYVEGQTNIIDILRIDPDRVNAAGSRQVALEFSYGSAIDRVANLCKIPSSNWNHSTSKTITYEGKKRQDAMVYLKDVSIVQAAKFLSLIQSTWVNLNCQKVKIEKKKSMADKWDVDFTFSYYY